MFFVTNNAALGGTYCFRATSTIGTVNHYDIFPEITLEGIINNSPYFTVNPIDSGSAVNTPTNYGTDVDFYATAEDDDGDDFYLAVCRTNNVIAGNNTSPTCSGGAWCISGLASSTDENACSYTIATSTEINNWYAFVCDHHAGSGVAKCSLGSQGGWANDNDSPFVVNNPPQFTSTFTVVDHQDPGSVFTIGTVSSDTDTAGTQDSMNIFVCLTNSATSSGCTNGVNDTVCSIIATTTPNASCDYADEAPTPAGLRTYYTFVYDSHGLAATTNSLSSSLTINNVAPVFGSLLLNAGNPISLNLKGAPDTTISVINDSLSDQNGCGTLLSATAVIYMSNVAGGFNCTADDNSCYQIGVSHCAIGDCSGEEDMTASLTCSADLKYFAISTDDATNNPNEAYNWLSRVLLYDGATYSATTSGAVELLTTTGLDIYENIIDFGSDLEVGTNTGNKNATTTIKNIGNSPISISVSGTNMTGNPSGSIGVTNIEWSMDNFSWSSGTDLTPVDQNTFISIAKPINISGFTDYVYWGIGIPWGTDASVFQGKNNFTAILDNGAW
jgi:hypothetical protein